MKIKGVISVALAGVMALAGATTVNAKGNWIETEEGWKYKSEEGRYKVEQYIDGWWLDENGIQKGLQASWKQDSKGWWYGDDSGWYAKNTCLFIDGKSYNFDMDGYWDEYGWANDGIGWYYKFEEGFYAREEWVDGYWIGADGYCTYEPVAKWYEDEHGQYYMDSSGYYISGGSAIIDRVYLTFDEEGYLIEYTSLVSNKEATELKLSVTLENKEKAARQLQNVLLRMIDGGTTVELTVDGVKKNVKNEDCTIYVDGKSLKDYISEVAETKNEVEVVMNTTTDKIFTNIFSNLMTTDDYYKKATSTGFTEEDARFDYSISFGGVTFNNLDCGQAYRISFDVEGKRYTATPGIVPNEEMDVMAILDVEGKHMDEDWVKTLVDSGAINKDVYITY